VNFLLFRTLTPSLLMVVNTVGRKFLLGQSCLTRPGPYIDAKFRAHVNIKMVSPEALDEKPIEHRRDVLLKLEISVSAEHFGPDTLERCIKVPKTKSVKKLASHDGRTVLGLELEVRGATTGRALMSACRACSVRESSRSTSLPMVDFVAKEDLIDIMGGKASIALRFLCLPGHHGTMDEEYQYANTAISKSVAHALQIDCCDIRLWPNFRAVHLPQLA